NLSTPGELQLEFARHGALADVCLVEGNKGLYDGLDLEGNNSNAALAKALDLPVVLVLDARGMTRGIAPLILGYQAFERSIRIAGVILSRLGGARHEAQLRAVARSAAAALAAGPTGRAHRHRARPRVWFLLSRRPGSASARRRGIAV